MTTKFRIPIAAALLVFALLSNLFLADFLSSPELHRASLDALNAKTATVTALTGTATAGSIAVAALPGDATTPIAEQIAGLSSYLMLVLGAILLEKLLLTLTFQISFAYLIPAACLLAVLYLFIPQESLQKFASGLALKLTIFALAICCVIPVSLRAGELMEDTFQLEQQISTTQDSIDTVSKQINDTINDDKKIDILAFLKKIGQSATNAVESLKNTALDILNGLIDAIALLIITNCALPILVLMLFLWLVNTVFGASLHLPIRKAAAGLQSQTGKTASALKALRSGDK